MAKSVRIITLGCSKNLVDSEKIAAKINSKIYTVNFADDVIETDVLIINTCGFILDAKKESIDTILQAIEFKNKKKIQQIIVTGCLTTRYSEELKKELPEVDNFYTVHEYLSLVDFLNNNEKYKPENIRKISTPPHYAYLKISEGCNRKCSFCAIPVIRGRYSSEPIELILDEAQQLSNKGVKELILVAQDLTYYGFDIYKRPMLANLLKKLSEIDGIEWIRLHYTFPQFFTNELIDEISQNRKICNYIDIPIQHISQRMLDIMRRKPNKKSLVELLYKIRSKINSVHLRTTVLVGHPGETKSDFKELLEFVNEFRFEKLGAFIYSHEEDTYSAKYYKDSISEKIKKERLAQIMDVQQKISEENNQKLIGTIQRVIIDKIEGDFFIGRTQFDSPDIDNEVLIKNKSKQYEVGNFYDMKILDAFEFDLIAE